MLGPGRSLDVGIPYLRLLCVECVARVVQPPPFGVRRRSRLSCWLLFWTAPVTAVLRRCPWVCPVGGRVQCLTYLWWGLHCSRAGWAPALAGWLRVWPGCLYRFILTHRSVCTRSLHCAPNVNNRRVSSPRSSRPLGGLGRVASLSRAFEPVVRAFVVNVYAVWRCPLG